jgi:bacillithiol biosynthesis cysteine-adding enzyme BshC
VIPLDSRADDRAATIIRTGGFEVRSQPLGGSPLSRAMQDGTVPAGWVPPRPKSGAEWEARAREAVEFAPADWLSPLRPALAATGRAAERIARAANGGVVVTTGQQPGLFGGPAYTFSKALSALAMADVLEAQLGRPVAPVFWAASDDADWHEAAVTHLVGPAGVEVLRLPGPPSDGVAMADVPLGDVAPLLARLRAASGSAAFAEVLDMVERAYVPHATVGAAYVQLLRGLLEPLGIAVLDAAHPALRIAADPLLRRALAQAGGIAASLARRTDDIEAAGWSPQVEVRDGLTLVFRTTAGEHGRARERVRERSTLADATRVAREAEPGTLGPNVLLRPVLERTLLPTVGYCAGPGEFAYFAQVSCVADALGIPAPIPLPRWSGHVVPGDAVRLLERLGLDEAVLADGRVAEGVLARAALDEPVGDGIERLRVTLEAQVRALAGSVAGAEGLVPATVLEGLQRDLQARIDRVERRLLAAVKRRESQLMRDVAVARGWFRPLGDAPERLLSLVPLLARYGPPVFDAIGQAARAHATQVVQGADVPA